MTTTVSIVLLLFLCEGPFAFGQSPPDSSNPICSPAADILTGRRDGVRQSRGRVLPGFHDVGEFDEQVLTFRFPQDVCITVNAPPRDSLDPAGRIKLILYALPSGNSTEQTAGKLLEAGDDWHYDIQHIAAQTRFLRHHLPGTNVIIAYLETNQKSWPAWRSYHPDSLRMIVSIVDSLRRLFSGFQIDVALSGHSGGGSFVFGFLNGVPQIPDYIDRIALLDANYAYEDSLHAGKLAHWLRQSKDHFLCVLAYNDSVALLNGKPFVSPTGGTWHRSHKMMQRLGADFPFDTVMREPLGKNTALSGRVQFLLMENPERAILHTVQVERNGFIQCIVSGTPNEGVGYQYFGERAYNQFLSKEKHPSLLQ